MMFEPAPSNVDYPAMEHGILEFWRQHDVERLCRERNRGREPWSFIDGPITANNPQGMGVHHAWGRTYKDVYQRFKNMQGFDQRFQNGFDCQGLWVEVEVEKALGLNSKHDIVEYGLDRFSRACRQRVEECAAAVVEKSRRLGQLMDWDHSYWTFSDSNIEHIWHFLQVCHRNGWLQQGHQVMPWCVRCGTSLSQHELIDSYRDMTHASVFLTLPLLDAEGEYLMVWTTTPWTLTSNTACAVNPQFGYRKVRQGDKVLYLSADAVDCLHGEWELLDTVTGDSLVGRPYRGPFHDLPAQAEVRTRVVPWDAVSADEGTGIVHIAPGCGAEDFELGGEHGLAVLAPIDDNGIFLDGFGWLTGRHVQGVAEDIFRDLDGKGFLYKTEDYQHRYPVCWRCGEELVFLLVDEWFITSDEIRPRMIEAARTVRWMPEHAGKLMENWLENMGDWCISRKRFWGLPLPFYRCACGHLTVVGSRRELEELAVDGLDDLPELHRPWIDAVRVRCSECGEPVERIPEVGDCWLDAGIVPFSTLNYLGEDRSYWEKWFPADFITEMREQIRLWFYSMLFMSVTLENRSPYRRVLVYEKMNDENGQPMHKSAGNAIWFDDAAERMGADVMRWLYARHNIRQNLNFGFGPAEQVKRELATFWNVLSFFVTYANLDRPDLAIELPERPANDLDRWILSRLHATIAAATEALAEFQSSAAVRAIESFVEDLSNWYVRRSRRRFWKSESDQDKAMAYRTLYECLATLSRLLAPILPFTAEHVHQSVVRRVDPQAPISVHLCDYPVAEEERIDRQLMADVETVMRVVRAARAARVSSQLKVRQPLARLYVQSDDPTLGETLERLSDQVLSELNIKALTVVTDAAELQQPVIKPNFGRLGPKHGPAMPRIQAAIGAAPAEEIAAAVQSGEPYSLDVEGETVELLPDEVTVEWEPRPDLVLTEDGGCIIALDTHLTPELIAEGWARDFVRRVQDMRKRADLQVSDRIDLWHNAEGDLESAMQRHQEYIAQETLCVSLQHGACPEDAFQDEFRIGEQAVTVGLKKQASAAGADGR